MKKLVNTKTGEEHLCEKIVIDGFDYYIGDNNIEEIYPQLVVEKLIDSTYCIIQIDTINDIDKERQRRIVATNNPNMDIPKVVDEVEKLAENHWIYQYIMALDESTKPYIIEDFKFGYHKAKETGLNSDEDMIEFAEWKDENRFSIITTDKKWASELIEYSGCLYTGQELLKLWKKQQPKIVYYA